MSASEPAIALVVAMGENRAIGRGGTLPWHLRSDMKCFRKVTMGKPVIMGRKTFESLPRVLDGRLNVVLTRDAGFAASAATIARSLKEGLGVALASASQTGANEIMIIGGEELFQEALPLADLIYLTEVHARPPADTWFPALAAETWREVFREAHAAGPHDDHDFSFVILERRITPSFWPPRASHLALRA